jgi:hypothetical protein
MITRSQEKMASATASTGFLLGLLFDHGDRGHMFLKNVMLSQHYKALYNAETCAVQSPM